MTPSSNPNAGKAVHDGKESAKAYPQTDADTPPVAKDQLGLFEAAA